MGKTMKNSLEIIKMTAVAVLTAALISCAGNADVSCVDRFENKYPSSMSDEEKVGMCDCYEQTYATDKGPDAWKSAVAYMLCAEIHSHLDHLDEAVRFSLAAMDAAVAFSHLQSKNMSRDQFVALELDSLSDIYLDHGKIQEAEDCLKEALAIMEKTQPPDLDGTVFALDSLADFYIEQHKLKKAESLLNRSISILEDSRQKPQYLLWDLVRLGQAKKMQSDYEGAEVLLKRALYVAETTLEKAPSEIGIVCKELVLLYEKWEKEDLALKYAKRAEAIEEKIEFKRPYPFISGHGGFWLK